MLSLPMAFYFHLLKPIVMLNTKNGNVVKLNMNRLHPPSSSEEESDLDYIRFCPTNQSKLDSCFWDDQYIACVINRDDAAHELSYYIIEAMFHHFIERNRYYFAVYTSTC